MSELELGIEEQEQEELERPFNYGYFRRMMTYARPYWRQVLTGGLMMAVVSAVNLAEPLLVRYIIDVGILELNMTVVNRVALFLFGLRILAWVAGHFQIKVMNWTGQ